jgi:outer membrane lipoprotein-sorting protein
MGKEEIKMFRFTTVLSLWLLMVPVTVLAEDHLADILEGIRTNYGELPGLTVSYKREVITKTMAMLGDQVKGDLATGKMYFKPPNFLKLEQETPEQEFVISNEETLWWYIPHQKRAYKYSARDFGKELRLLSEIFRGLIQVEERFQVSMHMPNELGEDQIELMPNPPWQNIDRIILTVTKKHDIRMVGIHYQLGATTIFTLNDITEEKGFEKDFFTFTVPEGVLLVEEKGYDAEIVE